MDWKEKYSQDGYVVFNQLVPHDLIDEHLAKYRELVEPLDMYARGSENKASDDSKRKYHQALQYLHYEHDPTLRLAFESGIRARVEELFGEDPVYDIPMTVIWGPGIQAHRDTAMIFRDPPHAVCRSWTALEDLAPDSGLMYVVPGTQKNAYNYDSFLDETKDFLPFLQEVASRGYKAWEGMQLFAPSIEHHRLSVLKEMEGKEKKLLHLRKGDTVLFDIGIIHGSIDATSPAVTRKSFIIEWTTPNIAFYPPTAYFGPQHDFRKSETALPRHLEQGPYGKFLRHNMTVDMEYRIEPIDMSHK
jgi:hypothetical protein